MSDETETETDEPETISDRASDIRSEYRGIGIADPRDSWNGTKSAVTDLRHVLGCEHNDSFTVEHLARMVAFLRNDGDVSSWPLVRENAEDKADLARELADELEMDKAPRSFGACMYRFLAFVERDYGDIGTLARENTPDETLDANHPYIEKSPNRN